MRTRKPQPAIWRWLATASLAGLVLAGCAPGSGGDDADGDATTETGSDETEDEDSAADGEEIVLKVLDARAGESQVQATYDRIDEEFEARNPGVTVERESINLEELLSTINLRLSESDVPDVTAVNQGHATMGRLIDSNLIAPLDDPAEADGWASRQSELLIAMNGRYDAEASAMAEGDLYAVSDTGAPVGLYYNQSKLDELGIDALETWDDVEAAMATAKEAGEIPLMFGNIDAWPGIHLFQTFWNDALGREAAADFVYGRAAMDEGDGVVAGATAQSWVENGWFADGWEGISYDQSWQRFGEGEGVFLVAGSWIAADLGDMNEDVRFMLMPPSDGGKYRATASGDFPWAIPTNAEHPDLAADYLAFRLSEDVARMYVEDGHIPIALPSGWEDLVEAGTLNYDMLAAWEQLEADDGMVPYMDWATPDFYEAATAEIQKLLGLNSEPQDLVDAWNAEWSSFHEQG